MPGLAARLLGSGRNWVWVFHLLGSGPSFLTDSLSFFVIKDVYFYMAQYKYTPYFENEVLRKRPYLKKEWCIRVIENAEKIEM